MKPTVKKLKNVRGRIIGYTATIGPIEETATTGPDASVKCESAVSEALERLSRGTYIGSAWGRTYVVAPTPQGWAYWLDTFSRSDYFCAGAWPSRKDAIDAALYHSGQGAWSPELDDVAFLATADYHVRRRLARWIGFQRAYDACPTDTPDKHRWACEHAREFQPSTGEPTP